MHRQSPALKKSVDFDILGMTFELSSQRFGILRKSCPVFNDLFFIQRGFRGFVLQVLEDC